LLDLKELALSVSTDPDHRFELAIALNDLETALSLVRAAPEAGSQAKWKVVGDKALAAWQMDLAQESFEKAGDLPALLLLFTSLSDRAGMERLAKLASTRGQNNIAFAAYLQLGDTQNCVNVLSKTGRLPEAALFARSYNSSAISSVVKSWRAELEGNGRGKVAQTIADPEEDRELFHELSGATHDSEGSGVMVEKEEGGTPADTTGIVEKAVEAVKEPVEGLMEKVQDLTVGNGGEFRAVQAWLSARSKS
jgi:coatomer subunit beta'